VQRTETILTDLKKLKQSMKITRRSQKQSSTKIEGTLRKQEQSIRQIEGTVRKLEQSIGPMKKTLYRQEQTNKKILEMLEQVVRPKILPNKNSQRFVRPKAIGNSYFLFNKTYLNLYLVSDFQSSTKDRSTSRSDQEISTNSEWNIFQF